MNPELAREAAQKTVEVHKRTYDFLQKGVTLPEIDRFISSTLQDLKCKSAFRGYKLPHIRPAFPSYACLSVNNCIVHGTAASYLEPLKDGDVLKIDVGINYKGCIGDAARTYIFGKHDRFVFDFVKCCKDSLLHGIKHIRIGGMLEDWAVAVENFIDKQGYYIFYTLGGHGYGNRLHMPPHICNRNNISEWHDRSCKWKPGMLVALEPMIAMQDPGMAAHELIVKKDEWPIYSSSGDLTAHFEHDILITENGPEILTLELDDIPLIVEE